MLFRSDEEEPHLDIAGCIQVTGASKPSGLLSTTELLSQVMINHVTCQRRGFNKYVDRIRLSMRTLSVVSGF